MFWQKFQIREKALGKIEPPFKCLILVVVFAKTFLAHHFRDYYKCNDRRDCEDGSDELGCDENFLRRKTQIVGDGEDFFLAAVSDAGIESNTKYELFEAIQTAFQVRLSIATQSIGYKVQRSAIVFVCGCEKFVIALAYLFCLALVGSCLARFAYFLADLCV